MTMRSVVAAASIGVMCLLLVGAAAEPAEVKALSTGRATKTSSTAAA